MTSSSRSVLVPLAMGALVAACSSSSSGAPDDTSDASTDAASVVDASGRMDTGATDAASDAGPTDSRVAETEAAAAPTCGPPPNRFTLLSGADAGLVRDNMTGLVWMNDSVGGQQTSEQTQSLAAAYCAGRGMRLPTEDEALALAAAYASCAFGQWGTWTSTDVGTTGDAWVVDYMGDSSPQLADNFPSAVLCVCDSGG
jgi:hypothetical protein